MPENANEVFSGMIDGVSADIVLTFVALAVISLQFFFCWKWDNILVRLIPSIVALGVTVYFFIMMTTVQTLEALGFLVLMIYSAIMLGATLIGWIVWAIFCFAHNRISSNPDGY
jgi:hypothetical protein